MRFDLELPATDNIKLVFLSESDNEIPNSIAQLIHLEVNTKDMFPSDFISIESGYKPIESSAGGHSSFQGPVKLDAKSDQFIITNKVKYRQNGSLTPLFYKHIIGDIIKDEAIKITDYYDVELSKDQYLVEEHDGQTFVFMNEPSRPHFISFAAGNKINKSFLNLTSVYKEAGLDNINNSQLEDFFYIYINNNIATSYNGMLYISYLSDSRLVRNALGNIDDNWNIGVLNTDFTYNGQRYWIPEYYAQRLSSNEKYRRIENKKCIKIFGNYIKSQYPISREEDDSLTVKIYDYYSKKLKYAFTQSELVANTVCLDQIYYQKIVSFSYDGMISLPVNLDENDIAFASHFTDEEYYEYTGVSLNSSIFDTADYFAIYMKPNTLDTESSLRYAIIGSQIKNVSTLYFDTIEDFLSAIDDEQSECFLSYVVAIVSITNQLENAGIKVTDVSASGGYIKDKKEICKIDSDVIYNDLLQGVLNLPTNDALIAEFDTNRLMEDGRFEITSGMEMNKFAESFILNTYKTIKKNIDTSTFPIIKINREQILDNGYDLITSKYYIGE